MNLKHSKNGKKIVSVEDFAENITLLINNGLYQNLPLFSKNGRDFITSLVFISHGKEKISIDVLSRNILEPTKFRPCHVAELMFIEEDIKKGYDKLYKGKKLLLDRYGTWVAWYYNEDSSFFSEVHLKELRDWIIYDIDLGFKIFKVVRRLVEDTTYFRMIESKKEWTRCKKLFAKFDNINISKK